MRGFPTKWFELSGRELSVLVVVAAAILVTVGVLNLVRLSLWRSEVSVEAARETLRSPARLDVNMAKEHELMLVPGIGEMTARALIAYRTQNGGFARLEDIAAVHGIGPKTIERARPHLMCVPPTRAREQ